MLGLELLLSNKIILSTDKTLLTGHNSSFVKISQALKSCKYLKWSPKLYGQNHYCYFLQYGTLAYYYYYFYYYYYYFLHKLN